MQSFQDYEIWRVLSTTDVGCNQSSFIRRGSVPFVATHPEETEVLIQNLLPINMWGVGPHILTEMTLGPKLGKKMKMVFLESAQ